MVAHSSTKAKFKVIALSVFKVCWLQIYSSRITMSIPEDTSSFLRQLECHIYMCEPVFHTKMKHLALDYFFVREKVTSKSWVFNTSLLPNNLQMHLLNHYLSPGLMNSCARLILQADHQSCEGITEVVFHSTLLLIV